MTPATAEAIMTYAQQRGARVTAAAGADIVRLWLAGGGFVRDNWGNYLKPGVPDQRWHFLKQVVQRQRRDTKEAGGGWYSRGSISLVEAADKLILEAAQVLSAALEAQLVALDQRLAATPPHEQQPLVAELRALRTRYEQIPLQARARVAGRKQAAVRNRSRAEEQRLQAAAFELASKRMASEARPQVLAYLQGQLPPPEVARLQEIQRGLTTEYAAALAQGQTFEDDGAFASIDQPPVLPLKTRARYLWKEEQDGVVYSVFVEGTGGMGAKVILGTAPGNLISVDPLTHQPMQPTHGAVGDGYLGGVVEFGEDGTIHARLFLIMAQTPGSGAGTRLLALWCRMLTGYGVQHWLAEAVGEGGAAFLAAMERRGRLRILGARGSYKLVQCL
jgi:hypothetical protein